MTLDQDPAPAAAPRGQAWWLYVLECRGGELYTGIAKDVDARFEAHMKGSGAKYTRGKQPLRIVARASFATKGEALRAEHALKQATRAEKLRWCAVGLEAFAASLIRP
jgi:putative endonuclease